MMGYVFVFTFDDDVLIDFIINLISIIPRKMITFSSSFKPKHKNYADIPQQYITNYPLEQNRKSIANHHPNHKVTPILSRKIKSIAKSTPKTIKPNPKISLSNIPPKFLNPNPKEAHQ